MSNSPLVSYTRISPNRTVGRNNSVDTITPHCVVGQCSVETLGSIFADSDKEASSNYGIGVDGRVGMYCEEKDRSWCTSSSSNDNRAITIECASDAYHPYAFKDVVYNKLIELCVDICKRYNKTKLLWLGDKNKTLNYKPAPNEMLLTVHRWFENKSCPGDWMYARMGDLANKVTAQLSSAEASVDKIYRVRKAWDDPKSQLGAYRNLDNAINACIDGYTVYDWNGNAVYPEPMKLYTLEQFVMDVQRAIGATVDGDAGPETIGMTVTLSEHKNSSHAAVKPVQKRLYALGYTEVGEADGYAGSMFTQAVEHFQRDIVDGEIAAGDKTWRKLLGME